MGGRIRRGGAGGDGGDVTVIGGESGAGVSDNPGAIGGGAATAPDGKGGDVTLIASPEIVLDGGTVAGGDGPSAGDLFIGTGDTSTGDPPLISISGPGTVIAGGNLTISGGTLAVVELIGLDPSAIALDGVFFLALGPGGEVALLDNNGLVFVAGQFLVFADAVTLDPGVSLGGLVTGPVTVQGSFFRYDARLLLAGQVTGFPGAQVVIPALLVNLGPLADSYRLEGVFGVQAADGVGAWTLGNLPLIVPVPGSQSAIIPLTVTIPVAAALGSRQPLTITAVSYTDARVRSTAQTFIAVRAGGARVMLPYVSLNGIPPAETPRLQYLPLVSLGSPAEIASVETQPEPVQEEWGWGLWLPLVGE